MWAPDVHKIKPSSALSQLLLMFGAVGLFAFGVYEMRAQPHAVSFPFSPPSFGTGAGTDPIPPFLARQLPRAYPHDGIVQALSGTSDSQYAVSENPRLAVCSITHPLTPDLRR